MAWRRPGDKPLSEPIMVSLPTHICLTQPQWVKRRLQTWTNNIRIDRLWLQMVRCHRDVIPQESYILMTWRHRNYNNNEHKNIRNADPLWGESTSTKGQYCEVSVFSCLLPIHVPEQTDVLPLLLDVVMLMQRLPNDDMNPVGATETSTMEGGGEFWNAAEVCTSPAGGHFHDDNAICSFFQSQQAMTIRQLEISIHQMRLFVSGLVLGKWVFLYKISVIWMYHDISALTKIYLLAQD